jgi:hypothetical protein
MKALHLTLMAALALGACKKGAEQAADPFPTKTTIAGMPMIEFDSPEAKFSCLAPRSWGIQRQEHLAANKGSVFIVGNVSIGIYKFPEFENGQYKDAKEYAESFWMIDRDGKQPVISTETINGMNVLRFHQVRQDAIPHSRNLAPPYRTDYALFPVKGGFYEIHHRSLADKYLETYPIFEAVVRSFKPKS